MIDTDKYEGHTPAPWQPWKNKRTIEVVRSQGAEKAVVCKGLNECDAQLIADAPELLAEVKWLEAEVKKMRGLIKNSLTYIECIPRTSDTIKLKFLIDDIRRYVLHEGGEEE